MTPKQKLKCKVAAWWIASSLVSGAVLSAGAVLSLTNDPAAFFHFLLDYQLVKEKYFRPVSDAALFEGASAGMVAALEDPYSALLTGKNYDALMEATSGEYGGIGVVVGMDSENHFRVLYVFPDSAAEKAGLAAGDELLSIDGKSVSSMTIDEAAGAIRGEAGTAVKLLLSRNGKEELLSVTRANVTMPTVRGTMAEGHIGYIRIFSFTKHTPEEFRKEYETLRQQGMEKMIIDLRMNPGGMIDSVVAVADQILTGGTIVSFHTKGGQDESYDVKGVETPLPMAVLIDRNSASASEILAGAVQDKKEGTIIGETSFGKGTVQTILETNKGTALKLSVAEYRTAAGRIIDKKGITPDIAVPQTGTPFMPGNDPVYEKALSVLEGK